MALPNGDLVTTVFNPQIAYPLDKRMQIDTLNSRDSMSMFIRWEGMEVYVLENSTKYILQGGISNEYWKELGTGSGTGGTTFVGQFATADLLPTTGRSPGDYAFVGTGDDFVQYNWDNIAGEWVMAEGQTDMASEFFHIGYKTPTRRPVIFPLFPKDVLVQESGDFVFTPETAVARFIFVGEVEAIKGIETAESDREIKLVNRTGSDIPLRDKASGIPSGSGFDFGGSDYTWVNGSEITLKGNGTYWELAPNNQVAFSDHLDSVNAKISVGSDGLEVITGIINKDTGENYNYKEYALTPSIVDGNTFIQLGSKYFKRVGEIKVKSFGAKGDGVTNDTSSISLAISVANLLKADLIFEEGIYLVSPQQLTDIKDISFVGRGNAVFLCNGTGSISVVFNLTGESENVTFKNLKFKSIGGAALVRGIGVHRGINIQVINCSFRDMDYGVRGNGNDLSRTIKVEGCDFDYVRMPIQSAVENTIVTGCNARNFGNPDHTLDHFIYIGGKTDHVISNNTCDSGNGSAVRLASCSATVSGNNFKNCTSGIASNDGSIVNASGNIFEGLDTGSGVWFASGQINFSNNTFINCTNHIQIHLEFCPDSVINSNKFIGNNLQGSQVIQILSSPRTQFKNNSVSNYSNPARSAQLISLINNSTDVDFSNNTFFNSTYFRGVAVNSSGFIFDSNTVVADNSTNNHTSSLLVFDDSAIDNKFTNNKVLVPGVIVSNTLRDRGTTIKNNTGVRIGTFYYDQENGIRIIRRTSAPTTSEWLVGDRAINTNTNPDQPREWICVASGAPGIWIPTSNMSGTTAQRPDLTLVPVGFKYYDTTISRPIWKKDNDTWTDINPAVPNASTTQRGIIEQATDAETITGTDTERAVSPANLQAKINSLILSATATLDFPTIAAGETEQLTATVTGAALLDPVLVSGPASIYNANDSTIDAWVSATNTVTVRVRNNGSSSIDPGEGQFKIKVFK